MSESTQTNTSACPVWTEGMLLWPQHLQQQDNFHETNLHERLAALTPLHWGIVSMKFDAGSLKTNSLQIASFRAVLPDGTPIAFDSTSSCRPPSRPIAPFLPATATSVEVFLALPRLREGVANFLEVEAGSGPQTSTTHRYRSVTRTLFDFTQARSEREISVSEPNVVLLYGSESRDDYTAIKIAEIGRDATGGYCLVDEYIPPCLALSATPWLATAVQEIVGLAVAKRRALAKFSTTDTARAFYLYTLGTWIPLLKHLTESPNTSPLAVYTALIQFAGGLMAFGGDRDPADLPAFAYHDLRATFGRLLAEIRRLLGILIRESYLVIPLKPRPDNVWFGELKDERFQRCSTFILAVETEVDRPTAMQDIPKLAKIASWTRIGLIVKQNSSGVPVKAISQPPPEIPVQVQHVYFALTTADPHWREIMTERNIALYFMAPYDPQRARLTLMAIPPED